MAQSNGDVLKKPQLPSGDFYLIQAIYLIK